MLSEVSQRLSQVNQKLYSVLGWSSASIAFLLFDKSLTTGPVWVRVIAFIALFLACVSAALCSKGIKSGVGKIPAETDWFCSRFYLDSMGMKRYHALLMFTLHQQEHLATAAKAEFLARAECLFIPGLILLALVLLIEKVPF